MTIEVMRIPITNKKIHLSINSEASGGTDFTYIQINGENIRVRTDQLWFWTDEWQAGEQEGIQFLGSNVSIRS
jgi:hypothetical protein